MAKATVKQPCMAKDGDATLERGQRVEVLGRKGSFLRVRTVFGNNPVGPSIDVAESCIEEEK